MIPRVLGVEKYYTLQFDDNRVPTLTEVTDFKSLGQLWCKAVAYTGDMQTVLIDFFIRVRSGFESVTTSDST